MHALSTLYFLPRHVQTLVRCRPLDAFLTDAGPVFDRHIHCTKAIARVIFQVEESVTVVGQRCYAIFVKASMLATFSP